MSKPDGGPAFPVGLIPKDGAINIGNPKSSGMTLRDYFAGQALIGILTTRGVPKVDNDISADVRDAYEYADAMLAERDR